MWCQALCLGPSEGLHTPARSGCSMAFSVVLSLAVNVANPDQFRKNTSSSMYGWLQSQHLLPLESTRRQKGRVARRRVSKIIPADQMWSLCFSFSICQVGRIVAFHYVLKTYNANMHIMPLAECSQCSVSGPLSFSSARMWPRGGVCCLSLIECVLHQSRYFSV